MAHTEPIHLLVTPVVMPGMSGRDLARQLGGQRPEMKVLYMLAFTLVKGQQQFESGVEPGAPTILKPFTRERLEKVREVLATKPRSPFDRPPDPWRNIRVLCSFWLSAQQRPTRDAADAVDRGGLSSAPRRVQASARAAD